ncbi:hypothetical protein [Hymenobacter metallilatus]|uniref:Outer membrane protein beta-barrel domain-containing protein n=1 Tax=Hymenobacter metallilatus TaxID=2493666 RepID=A0A428JRP8_9BACT|nr:hypothetical protein [Hymenobacter metallilatus]RSK36226.1 hypothetical protein EI290_04905 [Hymenobacter metallilatus]
MKRAMIMMILYFLFTAWSLGQEVQHEKHKPKFYISVSRGYNKYEIFYKNNSALPPTTLYFGPWQLVAALNVNNRLFIESSLLRHTEYSRSSAMGISTNGIPMAEYLTSSLKATGFPLMIRYALRKDDNKRLQVDILSNIVFVKHKADSEFKRIEGSDTVGYYYVQGSSFNVYAMVGVSGRYLVYKNLEIIGQIGFNHVLKSVPAEVHTAVIGNRTGLTGNHTIGLRYKFDFKFGKNDKL